MPKSIATVNPMNTLKTIQLLRFIQYYFDLPDFDEDFAAKIKPKQKISQLRENWYVVVGNTIYGKLYQFIEHVDELRINV